MLYHRRIVVYAQYIAGCVAQVKKERHILVKSTYGILQNDFVKKLEIIEVYEGSVDLINFLVSVCDTNFAN